MDVTLRRRTIGSIQVLDVVGELDLSTVPSLHHELTALVADTPGGVALVDLDGAASLDDAALGILLGAAGRARQTGGDVVIVCSDPRLRERFAITRLDQAIVIASSVHDVVG